jgi:predicted metal-dependent peptidase
VSEERYDALIFFTDFYTSKIDTDYHVPTLWVLSENQMNREQFPYDFPGNTYIRITDDCTGCERVD